MIIDTHAHLVCDELYPRLEEIVEGAQQAQVEKILIICTDVHQAELAISLAEKHQMFDVAVGFHPCDLYEVSKHDWQHLKKLLTSEYVVALGEIGLDYHWKDVEREDQKKGFIRQIQMANEVKKPILVHMRETVKDTLDILSEYLQVPGVMHCFSGSEETAQTAMKLGMYLSFGGPLTFKNARGLPEVAKTIPADRLFVETDCPYLTPHPFRGTQNEPKYITYTFDRLCELKNMSREELSAQMRISYQKLFHKESL